MSVIDDEYHTAFFENMTRYKAEEDKNTKQAMPNIHYSTEDIINWTAESEVESIITIGCSVGNGSCVVALLITLPLGL